MSDHMPLLMAINDLIHKRIRPLKIRTGVVDAIDAGLVSIVRPGSTESEDGLARIIPKAPAAGDRVAIANVGGSTLVLGVISAAAIDELDLGAPIIGQVFARSSAASAADTTSNTSTSVYVNARSATWADIPDGTYDIEVIAGAAFSHSSSGNPHVRCTAGGINGTAFGSLSITSTREQLRYAWSFSDVAIAGGVTVALEYKLNGGSGTISARNPSMLALFTFKGA